MERSAKRVTRLLTACLLAGGLVACGSQADDDGIRELKLSHFMEPTHPHEICGVKALNESLEGSGLRVVSYPSAQLGGESASLEQVFVDSLDMSLNGPSFLGVYHEDFKFLDAGYLFDGYEDFEEFQSSETLQEILDGYQERTGMKAFPAWYYGARHVTADKEIHHPSDLNGLKLRTPDAPLYRNTLSAMGASPVPMALSEVYLALQQGTIDAQENPITTIATMSLNDVQKYLILTGHMIQGLHMSISEKTWNSLTPEEQQALTKAIEVGGQAASECVVESEEKFREQLVSTGMEVVDVDISEFAEPVRREFSEGYAFSELYSEQQDKRAERS
ncbi:TRAP transporter substrate-binding protein DctP [Corynebacterium riegelii]|uniref:TRAP transporter substrate-binding protein DctP n=1 Tax=Corynebacterium riegelii TaxID=156976 RepID=UPI002889DB8C|nr:TRAP transporter substrate-binding protein DctP [Corynebacterium riegelii]